MKKIVVLYLCVITQQLWAHKFRVYCYSGANESNPLECYRVVLPFWSEHSITWNNRPQWVWFLDINYSSDTGIWYEFSSRALAEYIENCVINQQPISFMVKRRYVGGNNITWYFHSKETSQTHPPQLIYNNQVFIPTHDARVFEAHPNRNYGSEELWACNHASPERQEFFVRFDIPPTAIEEGTKKGKRFLRTNPSNFSSFTRISYNLLPQDAGKRVILSVYDITGNIVINLVNKVHKAGTYEVVWNGKDEKGNSLPPGCYFYKLKVGEITLTTKGVLLR